jgi:uncharacterized repeat protein (TIGR01451 family)
LGAIAVGLVALVLITATGAQAVHDLKFELDGDTVTQSSSKVDWNSLFNADGSSKALPANFIASGFKADYALPDTSTFATGSKDIHNISGGGTSTGEWQCSKSNNVGDKVDILNAYSTAYRDPTTNHLILYFGMERNSNNGDADIGMWFLKDNSVACSSSGGTTTFTGNHQDGDLLMVTEFTNGGAVGSVKAYRWNGSATTGSLGTTPVATGGKCSDAGTGDTACAMTNAAAITPPWPAPDKNGGSLDPFEFFEGGIDLTAVQDEGCFAKFLGNTRSSQSLTATLFDFAVGSLAVCRPSTILTKSASPTTVHIGQAVTYTYTEKNDGTDPLTNVSVTDDKCSPVTFVSGDGNANGRLDPGETWTFRCTTSFSAAGSYTNTAVGHGKDVFLNLDVTYCSNPSSPPAGVFCDQDERAQATIKVINPGTVLTKTASASVTYTYTERNAGDDPLSAVSVSDDKCSPVTYVSGDTNSNGLLDTTETWTFRCTTTINGPADVTNTATGRGTDSTGTVVTYCTDPTHPPTGTLCDQRERDQVRIRIEHL